MLVLAILASVNFAYESRRYRRKVKWCLRKCPTHIIPQGICASNGKVYTDECTAKCYKKSAEALFSCLSPFNDEEEEHCKKNCLKVVEGRTDDSPCESFCPTHPDENKICGSDGKIYQSACHLKCKNSNLRELFSCTGLNHNDCDYKCGKRLSGDDCAEKCPVYFAANTICASDNQIYGDICRARCQNPNVWEVLNCNNQSEYSCKQECSTKLRSSQCLQLCMSQPTENSSFCATNGRVYDNFCRAKCSDDAISFAWSCNNRGFSNFNNFSCANECSGVTDCRTRCNGQPYQLINGNNGLTFNSICEAECNGVRVTPGPAIIPVFQQSPNVPTQNFPRFQYPMFRRRRFFAGSQLN
jgi:hypothetical protein